MGGGLVASLEWISGRESKPFLIPLQLAAFSLMAFSCFAGGSIARAASALVAADRDPLESKMEGAEPLQPSDTAPLAAGLWTLYRDAGVMMELADYADRHGRDSSSVQELRFTALSLRFPLRALANRISLR